MERYIAIDGVCAWPNLTKMPDGAIVATIFNQPCHGLWEGDVECWASEDGGRTWRLRGTPAPHEPGTNRMNVAAGLAADGDLVVIASGWTHRPAKGEGRAGHDAPAHPLLPWVCRSGDGGRTWTQAETISPPEQRSERIIPFGDIVHLRDGTLGVCIYSWQPPDEHNCYFYISGDDGRTWSIRGVIQEGDINETAPVVLPDGELLACARTLGDQHLELFRSLDDGRTWRREQAVSEGSQHPAHLLSLSEERVLLTYGNRREGHEGIEVRLSEDAGRTWREAKRLVDLEPADLGYPATVPGDDDALVTAWYASGIAAHQRYHMGAAVWTLDELFGGL
ncbi:MAG: sialidase family protein [Anaerolineae bacterium]